MQWMNDGGIPLEGLPRRDIGAPGPGRSGRTTPREAQLGRQAYAERMFKGSLRPDEGGMRRRRRPASAGPPTSRRDMNGPGGASTSAAEKADGTDGDWRCGSHRYANAKFYETLRAWDGLRDVKDMTPPDWRGGGGGSTYKGSATAAANWGHDMSLNDADGWRRSAPVWVEKTFRGGLRDYPSMDIALDEMGNPKMPEKDKKHMAPAGEMLGSIYRSKKQSEVLTTAMADRHFMGSMRGTPPTSAAEYQRKRRAKMGLPIFKELSQDQEAKAKRIFAQLDFGPGGIDVEALQNFFAALGHKPTSKEPKRLTAAAEERTADMKSQLRDFARSFHGLNLMS